MDTFVANRSSVHWFVQANFGGGSALASLIDPAGTARRLFLGGGRRTLYDLCAVPMTHVEVLWAVWRSPYIDLHSDLAVGLLNTRCTRCTDG